MPFLLRMDDWQKIRDQFTEDEKATVNYAICGEVVCPRGCTIDEFKAGTVGVKVKRLLAELHKKDKSK
jgi:hypothetical protein